MQEISGQCMLKRDIYKVLHAETIHVKFQVTWLSSVSSSQSVDSSTTQRSNKVFATDDKLHQCFALTADSAENRLTTLTKKQQQKQNKITCSIRP